MTAPNTMPDELLSANGVALLLKARGLKPNTRYSVMTAIARGALRVAANSQWGVLVRREDAEQYATACRESADTRGATSAV